MTNYNWAVVKRGGYALGPPFPRSIIKLFVKATAARAAVSLLPNIKGPFSRQHARIKT